MGSKRGRGKWKKLETTVLGIQHRWGPTALRRIERSPGQVPVPHIPTGLFSLDSALGIGGIPYSRITELLGASTSGKTTLANIIIANAQRAKYLAAYVDLAQTLDPHYAVKCGVDLQKLLITQPHSSKEALEITISLIASNSVSVLVFDSVSDILARPATSDFLSAALRRLAGCTAKSCCAVIFLTSPSYEDPLATANYPDGFGLPYYASVRLLIERMHWLSRRGDICGYSAKVTVTKNKLAAPGKSAHIRFVFNGKVTAKNGDGE